MSKKDELDPKSQKIHQNWTRNKQQKSQVNGETEVTLHNQMLRTAAKSKQLQLLTKVNGSLHKREIVYEGF